MNDKEGGSSRKGGCTRLSRNHGAEAPDPLGYSSKNRRPYAPHHANSLQGTISREVNADAALYAVAIDRRKALSAEVTEQRIRMVLNELASRFATF